MSNHHQMKERELILVVDDDPAIRLLMREVLQQAGLTIIDASNGSQALELFEQQQPDLLLLDVKMPKMDGYEVCNRIRHSDTGSETPIIMITGLEDEDSIEKAYQAGATDFITKPVVWTILSHRVRYLLRAAKAFQALRLNQDRLIQAQQVARLGDWEWDIASDEFHWSDEMYQIFKLSKDAFDITLQACMSLVHQDDRKRVSDTLDEALNHNQAFKIEYRIVVADGNIVNIEQQGEVGVNQQGVPVRLYGTLQDISERKLAESRIRQLAYYDQLTGLPNRQLFYETVKRAMYTSRREGSKMALIFLDLDRFKEVNDTLGHDAGDKLLKNIAHYLTKSIRASDVLSKTTETKDAGASLSRLGGDEFTILLPDLKQVEVAAHVCNRVLDQLRLPMTIDGQKLTITGSMGIAIYPDDGEDIDALLRHSDIAMYHAKQGGKNNFCFYTDHMNEQVKLRLSTESDLKRALAQNEFVLHYEPRMDVSSGEIIAAEAQLRWNHPARGLLHPEHFMQVAEDSGLILQIGEWVLNSACQTLQQWLQSGIQLECVAINLSSQQLKQDDLSELIAVVLQNHRLDASRLELEFSDDSITQDLDLTLRKFKLLKKLGLRLSLDNFGIGYSPLAFLKKFPIDRLKIDRSLVAEISSSARDVSIIRSVLTLAQGLNICAVAQGVEMQEQLDVLKKIGCKQVQGPFISKPLVASEVILLLETTEKEAEMVADGK